MKSSTHQSWPPSYTIRYSPRARRLSLKVSDTRGLVVVLPKGMNERHAEKALEQHRSWVIKHLSSLPKIDFSRMPEQLELLAINESWRVQYQMIESEFIRVYPKSEQRLLLLQGPPDAVDQYRQLIKKWLIREAKKHLQKMIDDLSSCHGFNYNRLSIRAAKTRWGSCSSRKNISLNYKLLLMPKEYAEHIILHELCHTVHMDHSENFWSLLASIDPDWEQNHFKTRGYKTPLTQWLDY